MPAVPIKDMKQYVKAIEVLDKVGGTYQGVGQKEWFLLVTDAQYQALLQAKVVAPVVNGKVHFRGKSSKKKT